MSEHFITKCSCGAVITQCRCPDPNKKVNIIQNGCPTCKISAVAVAAVVDDVVGLVRALKSCVFAMEESQRIGCTSHLDCWDESEEMWYGPLDNAKRLLRRYEKKEAVN